VYIYKLYIVQYLYILTYIIYVYTNLKRSLDLARLLADQSLWRYVEGGRNSKYIPKYYIYVHLVIYIIARKPPAEFERTVID